MWKSIRPAAARCSAAALLFGAGWWLGGGGADLPLEPPAYGDVRESKKQQAFKSGGARSEIVLREMSATLKQIDGRLERMENIAAKLSDAKP